MKILLLITALGFAMFSASCRTYMPIDPNSMEPSTRCLPENVQPGQGSVHGTK